jgi:hypothetical protein
VNEIITILYKLKSVVSDFEVSNFDKIKQKLYAQSFFLKNSNSGKYHSTAASKLSNKTSGRFG